MDFEAHVKEFLDIQGLEAVAVVEDLNDHVIHASEGNSEFHSKIDSIVKMVKTEVLDLSVEKFMFTMMSRILLGFVEQDILILLLLDKSVSMEKVSQKADKFLNDLLINL